MSVKPRLQTRWKRESDRIIIYPYGIFYVFAVFMAVFLAGLFILYISYESATVNQIITFWLLIILLVALFWGYAFNSVEFDNQAGIMRKKLLGFVPVKTIRFSELQGISPVINLNGSYKYRLFRKDARYGKGIQVSCAYTKNHDPNAVLFIEEVVTTIHHYLDAHEPQPVYSSEPITDYRYFERHGEKYILKKNKLGSTVLGLMLLALGIHELLPDAWLGHELSIGRICMLIFTILGGPLIVLAGFTDITFNSVARILERKSPIGLGNRAYSFDHFSGIQTVRKSTNFIYSGTEVNLHFQKPETTKQEVIILRSFYKSSSVELLVKEVNSIMRNQE